MPLSHGKSKEAFVKNLKTEMHAGKPMKQSLAIAYNMRRRAGGKKMADGGQADSTSMTDTEKKNAAAIQKGATQSGMQPGQWIKNIKDSVNMADGGMVDEEDMARGHDKIRGEQTVQDDEMLAPTREPEHGAEQLMYKEHNLPPMAQNHEVISEQMSNPSSTQAYRRNSAEVRKEPRIGQVDLTSQQQGDYFAKGGEVKAAMSRRERALYAARGKPIRPDDSYAKVSPGAASMALEEARGSDATTRMPLSPSKVRSGPPASDSSSKEEQAMFAKGGYASPHLDMETQGSFYDRGGVADDIEENGISSARKSQKPMAEGYGMSPAYMPEEEGERFAGGGLFPKGNIAKNIMAKRGMKRMAEGGPVDEMGLQDQEYDPDRFLSEHMPELHFDHLTHLDSGDSDVEADGEQDTKQKKRAMISKIMANMR